MDYFDKNGTKLIDNSIIDLHQTVNGCRYFLVVSVENKDMRYLHDLSYKYQYDFEDALRPCIYSGETDWEIVK